MVAKNKSNEIKLTRIFDAPVKVVWEAWVNPEEAAHWYGPRGFTITTHSMDFRVGGSWSYTMHGPDGTDWENVTKFLEVEKYSKLVYDHGAGVDRPPLFRVTVLFSELGGKTKMEMTHILPSPEAAEEIRKIIKKAGGNSTWDRLAEYVLEKNSGKKQFVIARTFDTSLETMFEMWTDPKHFSQWLPPTGFTMTFIKADIRPGGKSFYSMPGVNGTMYGRAEYLEIEKPHRIVYTQQFCDENEKVTRHPAVPTWPETMLTTIELNEESPGRTRVKVSWEVHGSSTPTELATFLKERGGMTQGWTGSFDKLEDYLNSL